MKALREMSNRDKGSLLCKLFPEELENMLKAIKQQCDYFLSNEAAFRKGWQECGFFTATFWYALVNDAQEQTHKLPKELRKRTSWFSDQFFQGYHSLFTVHCLIEYADKKQCDYWLRRAIHLFFGSDRIVAIYREKEIQN